MTTAFVLSGGGSLGTAQVGMLQALGERGVEPDLLVETSAALSSQPKKGNPHRVALHTIISDKDADPSSVTMWLNSSVSTSCPAVWASWMARARVGQSSAWVSRR